MTQQAIQLGYLPRMTIRHTSATDDRADLRAGGQLDPARGRGRRGGRLRLLVAARLGLRRRGDGHDAGHDVPHVLRASATAGAIRCGCACSPPAFFMLIDATFFAAAMHKVLDGGWFPLALGAVVFIVMVTLAARARSAARAPARRVAAARRVPAVAASSRRRSACPGPPYFSPRARTRRRTRCCTASSTTRCCTSGTYS